MVVQGELVPFNVPNLTAAKISGVHEELQTTTSASFEPATEAVVSKSIEATNAAGLVGMPPAVLNAHLNRTGFWNAKTDGGDMVAVDTVEKAAPPAGAAPRFARLNAVHGGDANGTAVVSDGGIKCYNYTNSKLTFFGFETPKDKGGPMIACPGTSCYRRHMRISWDERDADMPANIEGHREGHAVAGCGTCERDVSYLLKYTHAWKEKYDKTVLLAIEVILGTHTFTENIKDSQTAYGSVTCSECTTEGCNTGATVMPSVVLFVWAAFVAFNMG